MRVRLFVDDESSPRSEFEPPGTFNLDTHDLADGPHTLIVQAGEDDGTVGVERIPFTVRNGPGIALFGLREGETVRGRISLLVNAFESRVGDDFEPARAETPAPIPTWAFVLSLVVAAWAMYYVVSEYRGHAEEIAAAAPLPVATPPSTTTTPDAAPPASAALGEQIYGNYCSACHQLTGEGLPGVFPPLKGDPVVTASDPSEHVRIILNGLLGKEIDDFAYASPMPAFGSQLSDAEIEAVVNHERRAWGNAAPSVTAEDVARLRTQATAP